MKYTDLYNNSIP